MAVRAGAAGPRTAAGTGARVPGAAAGLSSPTMYTPSSGLGSAVPAAPGARVGAAAGGVSPGADPAGVSDASAPAPVPSFGAAVGRAPSLVQPASASRARASSVSWPPRAPLLSAYASCPASARWEPTGSAGRPSGASTASASARRSRARATARRTRWSASGPDSPFMASWVYAGSSDLRTT